MLICFTQPIVHEVYDEIVFDKRLLEDSESSLGKRKLSSDDAVVNDDNDHLLVVNDGGQQQASTLTSAMGAGSGDTSMTGSSRNQDAVAKYNAFKVYLFPFPSFYCCQCSVTDYVRRRYHIFFFFDTRDAQPFQKSFDDSPYIKNLEKVLESINSRIAGKFMCLPR
jgi:hypothetical protein